MTRHRWMKFWPQDWQSDPALRSCGPAARGVWMELIAIAHFAEPYGHVLIGGKSPSLEQLSKVIVVAIDELKRCLSELETAGVFTLTGTGVFTSRRMIRDAAAAAKGRKAVGKRYAQQTEKNKENGAPNSHSEKKGIVQEAEAEAESKTPEGANGPAFDPLKTGIADIYPDRKTGKPNVAGWDLENVFERCMEAARIHAARIPEKWDTVVGWLASGYEPDDIVATIKRIAARPNFRAATLRAFDKAVREDCVPVLPIFVPEWRKQG